MISMLHGKNSSSHKRKVEERRKGEREGGKEGTFFQGAAAPIKLWPRPWWDDLVQHGQLMCVEHLLVILGASPA